MAVVKNWSALTDEELLPFVDHGTPGALEAAAERLQERVTECNDTFDLEAAHEAGVEEGRRDLADDLLSTYGAFLDDLHQRFDGKDLETLDALIKALKSP